MIIVRFKGGLGNQMFQYAFLKSLELSGKDVRASLGYYTEFPNSRRFELYDVFRFIKFDYQTEYDEIFSLSYEEWKKNDARNVSLVDGALQFWDESSYQVGNYHKEELEIESGILSGYWQSYKYFEQIEQIIRHDFSFRATSDLDRVANIINRKNTVSIHVRRNDYLSLEQIYGGICDEKYYQNAINQIKKQIDNPNFIFLSDDIEWVKKQQWVDEAEYISCSMFKNYQNWFDMYIMSQCNHNIIANSSFSWWGAWLNSNQNKIVIAPKKWNKVASCKDICPPEWVRI